MKHQNGFERMRTGAFELAQLRGAPVAGKA